MLLHMVFSTVKDKSEQGVCIVNDCLLCYVVVGSLYKSAVGCVLCGIRWFVFLL